VEIFPIYPRFYVN